MNRYCEAHKCFHGPLFICSKYPTALRTEIQEKSNAYRTRLLDPQYLTDRLSDGVPVQAILIMQSFAGIPEGECLQVWREARVLQKTQRN